MNKPDVRRTNYELRGIQQKIQSFTDLRVWQEGHALVIRIYELTAKFPQAEQFGLTSQLRRAAVSITSNIAEGFSRNTAGEKRQFYAISLGSLTEVQNQLLIARDLKFLGTTDFTDCSRRTVEISKMLNGLIKKTVASRNS
jgi:four helix bundle protein